MRIGVMLRHLGEHAGGVKIYTGNLLDHLLEVDGRNHYVLMYRDRELLGTYARFRNVTERLVESPSKLLWDQASVAYVARREKLDLIFNPKFSMPLLAGIPSVFVLQGSDWFVMPWGSGWKDRLNHRVFIPLYCKRADAIIVVSNNIKKDLVEHLSIEEEKIKVVYYGLSRIFRPVADRAKLEETRRKYHLPERFILFVGQIYPAKNFGGIVKAFAELRGRIPHKLVVAGEPRSDYEEEMALIDQYDLREDVLFTAWVPQDELPAIYTLADLFLFPSLYEGFGIPLLEAMACGCPIVTANVGSPPEVTDGAAVLVDPRDPSAIARGVHDVLADADLRRALIEKGWSRVGGFTWERCARETLEVFEGVNGR